MNAITPVEKLVTDHLDLWSTALKRKSAAGRGSSRKVELYGIKKLRELILELAVRGMLVPQDPSDEPASELLKRIAAEKAKLVKEGKIKKGKPLPSISGGSQHLPSGWSWTCMAALGEIAPRNEVKDDVIASFVPMPLISTRFDGRHDHESKHWAEIKKGYTHFADGDVAIAKITPCFENSKAAIFSGLHNSVGAGTTELHVVRPIGEFVSRSYLLLYLKSPPFLRVGETKMTGSAGQKRVPTEFFSFNPLPLPPLPEQHRIVAKVDELMALCDQLEQQTDASLGAHQTLVETLLNTLTSAADHAQFTSAWQRIAGHFDMLFTTEESIDQLKQTILQLAVMGKLVPQDPNDEPASELLKRIAAEKAKLVKEGKIKKDKPLSPVSEQELLFDLPSVWSWARFGTVVSFQSELVAPQDFQDLDQIAPDSIEKGTGKLLFRRTVAEAGITGPNNRFYAGQILYSKIRPSLSKAVIAEFDGLCSADMYPLRVVGLSKQYLLKIILSEPFLAQVRREENRIKMPKLNIPSLSNFLIAVPPLEEQHRIVAKVDELMTVCDQLKSRLSEAQTTQLHLADALTEKARAKA
ncbi:restriction endonuclease subunit S [Aquaspirillum serpens]|uniref:restriction endonuclease subunit S n=1 Tax=Aquaspirillum serpens TaxID=190 RepID=UPI0003B61F4A|nr:restriction endonuclease subunit S [Aquaspirillum serpens]